MGKVDRQATAVLNAGYELFWYGPVSANEVDKLEVLLGCELPNSFSEFLQDYGGGGVVGAEISGILDNNAKNDSLGTVWGDTKICRSTYNLPDKLTVIYFHDDEICWCIDGRAKGDDAGSIVSYSLSKRRVDRKLSPNFEEFLQLHFNLYSQPANQ